MIKKDLNTKQVSDLFGVNDSTVRRWAMAGKIKCLPSAGGHRKFSYDNIIAFANKQGIKLNELYKSTKTSQTNNSNQILKYALAQDHSSIEKFLIEIYLKGAPLSDIMDNYVEQALVKLQKKLDLKKISVAEEHIGRKIISKSLNNFKLSINQKKTTSDKNILCLNLENDIPDLPIDMIQILLENANYKVDNCGSNTSIENLKILLKNKSYEAIFIYLCDRQCCSATVYEHIEKTNSDLKEISILAEKYKIKLFLGGPSFKHINKENLKNYITFTKYSEALMITKL
mgnify:FL=1|tara:strand:- start:886 stop:1743 length:858 start_codon:yes stop_codon:yes gene_type:complete